MNYYSVVKMATFDKIYSVYSILIAANCWGCRNACLSQRDHDICLNLENQAYYWRQAEEIVRRLNDDGTSDDRAVQNQEEHVPNQQEHEQGDTDWRHL